MFTSIFLLAAAPVSVTSVVDSYPVISPDGRKLLFQSNRSGAAGLWLSDPDGNNPRLIFSYPDGDPSTPIWSRDGKTIIMAMRPDDAASPIESEIFSIDADGQNLRRLTTAAGDDSHPHLSGDGTRIFFNSTRQTTDINAPWPQQKFGIYSMAIDGSDVRLQFSCDGVCTYPSPSPDGTRITYRQVSREPGFDWEQKLIQANSEVFIAGVNGENPRNLSQHPAFDGWPTWSGDGKYVIFASARDGVPFAGQIFKADANSGEISRVTPSDGWSRAQPSVAKDGSIFVFELKEDARSTIGHIAKIEAAEVQQ